MTDDDHALEELTGYDGRDPTHPCAVIIIGAMKAGTTTLFSLLKHHPKLAASQRKELDYFGEEGPESDYLSLFPAFDAGRHAYCLEASPNYTKAQRLKGVPSRIATLRPAPKLIYILRDPVARLESHIHHNCRQGRWTYTGIGRRQIKGCVAVSSYARQIGVFEQAGLWENMLLLDFAQLVAQPEHVLAQVYDFLGIAPHMPRDLRPKNVNREKLELAIDLAPFKETLRADTERLIQYYGFEQARDWRV